MVERYGRARVLVPAAFGQGVALVALVLAARAGAGAIVLVAAAAGAGSLSPAIAPSVRALLGEIAEDREIREIAAAALANPALRVLLAPMALMGMALERVGLPSLALHAGSPPSSGLLLALWSAGSLSGGLWYGYRSWRSPLAARYRVLTVATVISTAPLIRTIPEELVAAVLAGVTIAPAFPCLYALVGRIVSPGVETEAFTWAASSLIVGLAMGSALGGAAIDAAGVSGPFVLSCGAAGVTALLALRARERPTPVAG
jgi:MFS family permease